MQMGLEFILGERRLKLVVGMAVMIAIAVGVYISNGSAVGE